MLRLTLCRMEEKRRLRPNSLALLLHHQWDRTNPSQMEKEFSVSRKSEANWNFTRKPTTVTVLFQTNTWEKVDDHGKHITDRITLPTICPMSTENKNIQIFTQAIFSVHDHASVGVSCQECF